MEPPRDRILPVTFELSANVLKSMLEYARDGEDVDMLMIRVYLDCERTYK